MATATTTPSLAARFLEQPKRMLIDGEWVVARHGGALAVCDPAVDEAIDRVASGDAEDMTEVSQHMDAAPSGGLGVTQCERSVKGGEVR